jgi:SSS family solute:Na+ symporter
MELNWLDLLAFVGFIVFVIAVSLYASRKEETAEDYFLAGRNLTWWLIGFSLIASNISSEHFVGMGGKGFELGLAIASFEWIAAISLVIVALVLLPLFLRLGIYTIPEFLEHRFNSTARTIMAVYVMVMYVVAALAGVLYTGGITLQSIMGWDLYVSVWVIGLVAGAYTVYGGLKAVVWSDLIQGATLLIGGAIVVCLGMEQVGGWGAFFETNQDKLHMVLPADHPDLPWTIFLLGIWIPNICYWGLNQFITQRTLGAKSLKEGQWGIIFAAALKLVIPFLVVFPGIIAFQLYQNEIGNGDQAFPFLIKKLLPAGLRGVLLAALFGAIMSSLDSMLNSASTIFTIDIYKRYFVKGELEKGHLVKVGRWATACFVIFACLLAPELRNLTSIYDYMQQAWNFIWPGVLAAFVMGIFVWRTPSIAAVVGMLIGPVAYAVSFLILDFAYLNAAAVALLMTLAIMGVITAVKPRESRVVYTTTSDIDLSTSSQIKVFGWLVILATIVLYIIFW